LKWSSSIMISSFEATKYHCITGAWSAATGGD
jgi:hypothetical protein